MILTGDMRSAAHSGDALKLCRTAAKVGDPELREYMFGASKRWAPRWALEYTLTRDAGLLVPHATWSEDDPLRCLARGTLSLDGRPWWEATERAGLRWSVGVRWDALPHWEGWAPEHAPEHLWAPRRAIIALHGWLEGRVSDVELGRAREAAVDAAYAAYAAAAAAYKSDAAAAYTAAAAYKAAAAAAYTDVADAVAYAAAASTAAAAARADARDSLGVAWTQYALVEGTHTTRIRRCQSMTSGSRCTPTAGTPSAPR